MKQLFLLLLVVSAALAAATIATDPKPQPVCYMDEVSSTDATALNAQHAPAKDLAGAQP